MERPGVLALLERCRDIERRRRGGQQAVARAEMQEEKALLKKYSTMPHLSLREVLESK